MNEDVDVRGDIGDHTVQPRRPHLPQTVAVQVAQRRQRPQAQQRPSGRSLARRVFRILLPAHRQRSGKTNSRNYFLI